MNSWIVVVVAWLHSAPFIARPCVHGLHENAPRFSASHQAKTRRLIDFVVRRLGAHEDFRKLLHLVAARESSYQQGLVHHLPRDLEASAASFPRTRRFYAGNPYSSDPTVWQTYGLFGMNSNYFTLVWDKTADPRILCDAIVDVLVYRRSAARMLRKVGGTIVCKDEQGKPFNYTTKPTWQAIHRAVSGGNLCPSKHEETAATMRKFFRGRAARVGLDPDGLVSAGMLGDEPRESEDQKQLVMALWREFEAQERQGRT